MYMRDLPSLCFYLYAFEIECAQRELRGRRAMHMNKFNKEQMRHDNRILLGFQGNNVSKNDKAASLVLASAISS
jgi:hypothetical protein